MVAAVEEPLTVDELAARTGTTVRTVRFYTSRGLLPPPRLRGRVGLYGPEHVGRLELIRHLQGLGFTLAAIEAQLARIPADTTAAELALRSALFAPWLPDRPERLDRAELDRRAGRRLDEAEVALLGELGVLADVGPEQVELASAAMLSVGLRMLALPLRRESLLRARDIVARHTSVLAEELRELFDQEVLRPYRERDRSTEQVRDVLERLRPLTIQALVTAFQQAMDRSIRDSLPTD
ncbi:MerR family transcriptional regulator [Solihabitans fulvus]|uniref:MerR family transcriptional regulator n=1 Tax=Solihabitans fulvus TaxID=1892852 RepID=A0A5B2XPW6_9PSEU|nr:MerR family transcriptional regulator [Solihabitans fulvus]KAA2264912.1 MerR family transcriptional regulator [Solihabitans fulvus]